MLKGVFIVCAVRCSFAAVEERQEASATVNGTKRVSRRTDGHANIQTVQHRS